MVRAHDELVRRALKDKNGRVVKHTGDGIMASFDDATASVHCARAIQQSFEAFNVASEEKLQVRIGIDVGEPIPDSNDLFGATVQRAARLCQTAEPDAIVVSSAVKERVGDLYLKEIGRRHLKGFPQPAMYTTLTLTFLSRQLRSIKMHGRLRGPGNTSLMSIIMRR